MTMSKPKIPNTVSDRKITKLREQAKQPVPRGSVFSSRPVERLRATRQRDQYEKS
jgi:hypothetical protein